MKILSEKNFDYLMATAVLLILAIPVGIANIYLGFIIGEGPCTLCWWERMGMVIIGVAGILILRYGMKARYIASVLFAAAFGIYMSLRHTSFHAYRDVGMGFGGDIFGAHTYVWGLLVYWVVVIAMGIMILFTKNKIIAEDIYRKETKIKPLSRYAKFVIALSLFVVLSNALQALISTGIPPYSGKHDPERISLNNTWTMGVWKRLTNSFSFTGPNIVEAPFIAGDPKEISVNFNLNSSGGAFVNLKQAPMIENSFELDFKTKGFLGKGFASGLAYNPKNDTFAIINTEGGIYFTDKNFKKIAFGVIDKPNGKNIQKAVASTFDGDILIVAGYNKTIFAAKQIPKEKIDSYKEWNTLRQTSGEIELPWYKTRDTILTIRAKKRYVLTISKDKDSDYFYLISVPNDKNKGSILIKVDSKDRILSGESIIKTDLKLKDKRNIDDYYITAGDIKDGKYLAYSKNYNTLLIIDLENAKIIDAYKMPNIGDISGMAIKDDSIFTLSHKNGKVLITELLSPI